MRSVRATGGTVPLADKRRARGGLYVCLLASDILAVVCGFLIAALIRFGGIGTWRDASLIAAVLPLFVLLNSRSFSAHALERWRQAAATAVWNLFGAVLLTTFVAFLLKSSGNFSRLFVISAFLFSAILMVAARTAIGLYGRRLLGGTASNRLLILDGAAVVAPPSVGLLNADELKLTGRMSDPIELDRLARSLRGVDEAFVACPPERRSIWAMALKGSAVRAELLVPELDSVGVIGSEHFAGVATVLISTGSLGLRARVQKRALDLAIGLPAVLLLAPLMIIVALAIRLDSKGPVLFVQSRVGLGNGIFPMFKFRSMRASDTDEHGHRSTHRDDDRITRVGRFIRATSIDELPQLLNILRGDMSFVGPRPHAIGSLAGDQLFWEVDERYHHRHACKPGLTGLAQVRGFRGATHRREDLVNRLDADLEYLNEWSLTRDLLILLSTIRVVVHRNAF